jgi:hypothetical protein
MFTSEPPADSPIRQRQAHLIPLLSRQLNELDSTFQLPEGPYTFEYEHRAKDIMYAACNKCISSNAISDQPQAIIPSSSTPPPCVTSDAVISITPVDSEKADGGGDIDDSEVIVGNEQIP